MQDRIERAKAGYATFLHRCGEPGSGYRLTPSAEPTPFGRCFALFGFNLLGGLGTAVPDAEGVADLLRAELREFAAARKRQGADLRRDKPCLQLLTFTLSSLALLRQLERDPLGDLVEPLLTRDVGKELDSLGVFEGRPQSGNQAMFMAILLLHAGSHLGMDRKREIGEWVELHLARMNRAGFWGPERENRYLLFQNGYHQYEILCYLGVDIPKLEAAAGHVSSLADSEGHFAPYPGGGGCYDYDALSLLCHPGLAPDASREALLRSSLHTLLAEQNLDGGFCESRRIRPRSLANLSFAVRHVFSGPARGRFERLRHTVNLQRPKHDRIGTHWSRYSRAWGESDLWDSWFRMQAVATLQERLYPEERHGWGFIDYPGIGFHWGKAGVRA